MDELLGRLLVWRVMLVADPDVQGFYRKCGFEPYLHVMAKLDRENLHALDATRL